MSARVRSLLLNVVLPLLLLFSQQGLLLHEMAHGFEDMARSGRTQRANPNSNSTPKSNLPPSHACEKCVSLASVTGAVAPGLIHLQPGDFCFAPPATLVALSGRIDRLPLHNRGPPVFSA